MTSAGSGFVVRHRPPMSAGERWWFLAWSVASVLVLLAVYLSGYHFSRYEMTLRGMDLGQIPFYCDLGFKLSRMMTHYVAWILCLFGGLALASSYWRVRWLIPFAALLPAALLAGTQCLVSAGMRQVEVKVSSYDLGVVDRWLEAKDALVQADGDAQDKASVERGRRSAMQNLSFAFAEKDAGAPARFVLLGLLDPNEPLRADWPCSRQFCAMTGIQLPVVNGCYAAADLYAWWQTTKGKYTTIPLLEEWLGRVSTRQERIPAFEKIREAPVGTAKRETGTLNLSEAIAGGRVKVKVDALYFPGRVQLTIALQDAGVSSVRFDGPFLATPTGKAGPAILLYKKLKREQSPSTSPARTLEWMVAAMFLKPPVAAYADLVDFTVTSVSDSDPALRLLTPAVLAGDFDPYALEIATWVVTADVGLEALREGIYQLDTDRPGDPSSLSSRKEPGSHVHDSEVLDRAFEILEAAGIGPSTSKLWQETEQELKEACQNVTLGTYRRKLIFFYTRKEAQQAMVDLYRKPVGPEPKLGPMDEARSMRSDLIDYRACILRKFRDAAGYGPGSVPRGHRESAKLNWKNCADTVAQLMELESNPTRKSELRSAQQKFLAAIRAAK